MISDRRSWTLLTVVACLCLTPAAAQHFYFSATKKKTNDFTLASPGRPASLFASDNDYPGVIIAMNSLKKDISLVTDGNTGLIVDKIIPTRDAVIAGTIGHSLLIDQLIQNKKINVDGVTGQWEASMTQIVDKPFPGVDRALVVAGSDKRGTIFGIYEISKRIGVSPWYWWADVPVKKNKSIFVESGFSLSAKPSVKYRGIFLNDEEPSLGRWAVEKYGGFNHELYEKVFELILRLKGNYLWPAMWWPAFNADDPLNPQLADEYGIVMGTSHHEPMMRAHAEWRKLKSGDWNYETNAPTLQKFWREGIERMSHRESIVTLAMRGDGDMAMSAETKTALLEKIVSDQRDIIREVTKKDITQTPQVWAIYKEVQDYYDQGMRVPDDVTLLFCDDNWGNIRKLPARQDKSRQGGYGIYYHFDYVGDPRNYKWLNTNPITKVWEQMHLAYEYGVDRIWIVNVGDLKPMEFPISFFLDYAWDPVKFSQNDLGAYTRQWCEDQFGKTYAEEIARIISGYTKLNARRKPELLSPETYSIVNYREAERIVSDYHNLEKRADEVYDKIPAPSKDAFYQLVLYPVRACANLNDLYMTVGKNRMYAAQGRALTNELGQRAKNLYRNDSLLSAYYNNTLAGGKWHNMMNQIHIGYTYWQDPKEQVMPVTNSITLPVGPAMGVAIEGSGDWWPSSTSAAVLPEFNSLKKSDRYIDIFNRGTMPFDYTVTSNAKWLKVSSAGGRIESEDRIHVSVDWSHAPAGTTQATIDISGPVNSQVSVRAVINNTKFRNDETGFAETDHYISIEPEHFDNAIGGPDITWQVLPDYGRTLSGVTPFPVTANPRTPGGNSPHLEYNLLLTDTSAIDVQLQLGATLNYNGSKGLLLGLSIDDQVPRVINIHQDETPATWARSVEDNMRSVTSRWKVSAPGKHVLKYWMIDPGIVLQKILIDAGGLRVSYLGPPESPHLPIHEQEEK